MDTGDKAELGDDETSLVPGNNTQYNEKALEAAVDSKQPCSSVDGNLDRGKWSGKLDFLLSCLSYAVGLGNIWRFPYLCYQNGGGAFLIPYSVMLIFAGLPMFFFELSFGQFAGEGVISIWKVCPLFQGIGWGMFIVSCLVGIYYNVIISWTIFYFLMSINKKVPWTDCDNQWNTPLCSLLDAQSVRNCTDHNGIWFNNTCLDNSTINVMTNMSTALDDRKTPSDEYFHHFVLGISDGLHEMGVVRWQNTLALLASWTLVCLCLIKGVKSQGKVAYFTATFPYLVLLILLIRGVTLPGAVNGILFYLTPQWHRLATAKVWGDAAVQIFFSLSPGWGGLITLASYNKFHNNVLRDAVMVSIGNCLTSFFAGFVIFGIIGFMAHEMMVPVGEVASGGAGLAFIIYPEVVTRLPISPLWSMMFFAMLITLGLGTQFSIITTVHTTLLDVFPRVLRRERRPTMLMIAICAAGFLLGLIFCTEAGMYVLQLADNYAATYSVLIIALCECLVISYIYGVNNFIKDIAKMLDRQPTPVIWWKAMWCVVTPALLIFIMIFTWIDYTPSKYGDYSYPVWADVLGWMMSMSPVTFIPGVMLYHICTTEEPGSLWTKIKFLARPTPEWGPAIETQQLVVTTVTEVLCMRALPRLQKVVNTTMPDIRDASEQDPRAPEVTLVDCERVNTDVCPLISEHDALVINVDDLSGQGEMTV